MTGNDDLDSLDESPIDHHALTSTGIDDLVIDESGTLVYIDTDDDCCCVDEIDAPVDGGSLPVDDGTFPGDDGTFPVDDGSLPVDDGTFPVDDGSLPVDDGTDVDYVDPTQITIDPQADTIAGHPEISEQYWLFQGDVGSCAPTSVAIVLSEVLGVPLQSNQDVVERAEEMLGIAVTSDQWVGLTTPQTEALIESYGVECTTYYGDTEVLAEYLEAGHAVMLAVDSDEVLFTDDDDLSDGGDDANHMLVITGIDQVNGLVYLNNPNNSIGPSVIPLEQFEDAWADSYNEMLVTDLPIDQAGQGISQADATDLLDEEAGQDDPYDHDDVTTTDVLSFAPDAGVATTLEIEPIEPVEDVPDGVTRLILLPFTFLVRMADEVKSAL